MALGNLGISTLNTMGKFTHSKTTQAHQKHRGLLSIVFAIPTVATPLAMPILHEPGSRSTPPPYPQNLGDFPKNAKKVNKPLASVNNLRDTLLTVKLPRPDEKQER